jgi:hypothetical protein
MHRSLVFFALAACGAPEDDNLGPADDVLLTDEYGETVRLSTFEGDVIGLDLSWLL